MHSNLIWFCQLGLLCDLLWSDPDKEVQGWGENDRGVSFTFGPDIVSKFLAKHDLDLICRAHQVRFISGPSCSKGGVHGIKMYPVDNTILLVSQILIQWLGPCNQPTIQSVPGKPNPQDIQLNLLWGGYAFLLSEFQNSTFHLLGSLIYTRKNKMHVTEDFFMMQK